MQVILTSIIVCPWVLCRQLKERYFWVEPPGIMVDLHQNVIVHEVFVPLAVRVGIQWLYCVRSGCYTSNADTLAARELT